MGKLQKIILVFMIMVFAGTGCGFERLDAKEKMPIDYTVLGENDIPKELIKQIEETQDIDFKLTYTDDEYLYIAKGYGAQKTGGYSISVLNLYASSNALYFETNLMGPRKGEKVAEEESYPYIVVKVEKTEQPVVFK